MTKFRSAYDARQEVAPARVVRVASRGITLEAARRYLELMSRQWDSRLDRLKAAVEQ